MKEKNQFRALLVYPNLPLMLVPPLSMALFTRVLKDEGYQVELFDTTSYLTDDTTSPRNRVKYLQARKFDETDDLGIAVKWGMLDDFRKRVLDYQPDVMFFSVVEDTMEKSLQMLKIVEDLRVPHLLGGVFPTAAPAVCIGFDSVKMIGIGEGEKTIVDVAEAIRKDAPLDRIMGTWYKATSGEVSKNPAQPLVDIGKIVPDFTLFDSARFIRPMGGNVFRTFPIESYRGCPYLCTYCNSPMQRSLSKEQDLGNFLRRKKLNVLESEITSLVENYDPEFLYFVDDSFLARPKKEVVEFCEFYKNVGLPFWFNTRPENCTENNMRLLKEAGCYRISFGIECGNESYRKNVLLRNVTNDQIVESFRVIAESQIPFSINLIIGMPGETRELVFDTIELVRSIGGYDTLTVSIFTPYHGTVLRNVAVKNKWLNSDALTKHTTSSSLLDMPPPYLSAKDIDGLMRVIPLYVYFPKNEWNEIRKAEIADSIGDDVLAHYSGIYQEKFLKSDQYDQKEFVPEGGTGCKSNPLDSYKFIQKPLNHAEIAALTMG